MNKFLVTFKNGTTKTVVSKSFTAYNSGASDGGLTATFFNSSGIPDEWGNPDFTVFNVAAFIDVVSIEQIVEPEVQ